MLYIAESGSSFTSCFVDGLHAMIKEQVVSGGEQRDLGAILIIRIVT
jgi:hypothetical protein